MKRSPIKRKATTKRRTTPPRCSVQRCNKRAEIRGWCISHAEQRADRLFSRWVRDRDDRCTAAGVLDGECRLDLAYAEDRVEEVDANIVMLEPDRFVEVQGTGEAGTFDRAQLDAMLDLARDGCARLFALQREALGA